MKKTDQDRQDTRPSIKLDVRDVAPARGALRVATDVRAGLSRSQSDAQKTT